MELFYQFYERQALSQIQAHLSRSEWELWALITTLDPFGDRQIRITWDLAKSNLAISRATFYRAIKRLKDLGLVVVEKAAGFFVSLKNETSVSPMRLESQKCDSESQKRDSSLYIDLQTSSYSLRRNSKKRKSKNSNSARRQENSQ